MKNENVIILDLETRSFVDLPNSNAWIYAKDPSTDVICMAWKDLNIPGVSEWNPVNLDPDVLYFGFQNTPHPNGTKIVAHNALFEYSIFYHVLIPRYGFPKWLLDPERWLCTQGMCYAAGLPGKLEEAAKFLNCKNQKLETGNRLINLYSKPAKERGTGKLYFREMTPGDRTAMEEYNRVDVLATEEIYNKIGHLTNHKLERRLWLLDFKQNVTGLPIDRKVLNMVQGVLTEERQKAEKEMDEIGVNVRSPKQMKEHFAKFKYKLFDLQADTVEKLKKIVKEENLLRLLTLRKFLAPASVKKYTALENRIDEENILRLWVKYHKAHTGRWASLGVQLHNLPRTGSSEEDIIEAIQEIKKENYDYETLIKYAKIILPGLIKADRGKVFLKGDFSAIEARVIAELAGEEALLKLFKEDGPVYESMGSLIFGIPVEKIGKKDLARLVGKIITLAGIYGMGPDKFIGTCATYGIDVPFELADKTVKTFRQTNARIKKFWYDLQSAFILVWKSGGTITVRVGKHIFITGTKGCIQVTLPSKRSLYYHRVKYVDGQLSFFSPEKKKRIDIWGGVLAENVTQAVARDLLAECMIKCDESNLNPVLHVHDEIVCLIGEEGEFRGREMFDRIMNTPPDWFAGFPLKTESEVCRRYFK